MKYLKITLSVILLVAACPVFGQNPVYELVWSDEFDGNGAINAENWHHQTLLPNGDSWYNGEIQHYTNRQDNSNVSEGTLKIVAKKETFTDQGVTKEYTSARLNSKFAFTYGKVEVRAKLPTGIGTWPAIWSLGQNITEPGGYWADTNGTTPWPACGELDIMEHWGNNQDFIQSAIHTPSSHGNTENKGGQIVAGVSDEFHVYTMEWTSESMTFSVDDNVHYVYQPSIQNADTWPFDANQYLLLNVAILPEIDPSFVESTMEIDYVRVYQESLLGLNDFGKDSFSITPNPANTRIDINAFHKLDSIGVYNSLGNRILFEKPNDITSSIDISNLSSGLYFVKVNQNGKSSSKKLIIN